MRICWFHHDHNRHNRAIAGCVCVSVQLWCAWLKVGNHRTNAHSSYPVYAQNHWDPHAILNWYLFFDEIHTFMSYLLLAATKHGINLSEKNFYTEKKIDTSKYYLCWCARTRKMPSICRFWFKHSDRLLWQDSKPRQEKKASKIKWIDLRECIRIFIHHLIKCYLRI